MKFLRRVRLVVIPACVCALWVFPVLGQQQPPAGPPPQQQPPTAPATPVTPQQQPPARPANPFETIPVSPEGQPPAAPATQQPATQQPAGAPQQRPQLEAPPAVGQPVANPEGLAIEGFEFRGAKRVPQDTLKALILSKPGDIYNDETLRRDFMALWNTGRFDDIRLETEPGRTGVIVRFVVTERRVVRSIKYEGIKSVTVSEILDRFKERKVGLSVESQYDPNKVQRAAVVLQGVSGRARPPVRHGGSGRSSRFRPRPSKSTFKVNEGPKVKVGEHRYHRQRGLDRQMGHRCDEESPSPSGFRIRSSSRTSSPRPTIRTKLEEDKERIREAYQDAGLLPGQDARPDRRYRDIAAARAGAFR